MKLKKYNENQIVVPRFNEANGFYTTKKRSELMSKIKSRNTKPEARLKQALWSIGIRYRKNVKTLPGTPDIVFFKYKLALFVDGEFWHGHNWDIKKNKLKTNRRFWIPKIERNMQRDLISNQLLSDAGWKVMRFWEKEVNKDIDGIVHRIMEYIHRYSSK